MSRDFTRASSHRLTGTAGTTVDLPFSLVGWFRSEDATVDGRILSIGTAGSVTDQGSLSALGSTGGDPVSAVAQSTEIFCNTSTGFTANIWAHAAGIYRSATDRSAFIDGGSEGTSATSRSPTGTALLIGARHANTGTASDHFEGQLAHAAIYGRDLEDAEVAALALGVPPSRVARLDLQEYWPLHGFQSPEQSYVAAGASMTLTNTPGSSDLMPPVCPLRTRRACA